jgi:hypothetical protein
MGQGQNFVASLFQESSSFLKKRTKKLLRFRGRVGPEGAAR